MKLVLEMEMDNAAFEDGGYEAARILREVARMVEEGYRVVPLRDINGNRVGLAEIIESNPRRHQNPRRIQPRRGFRMKPRADMLIPGVDGRHFGRRFR